MRVVLRCPRMVHRGLLVTDLDGTLLRSDRTLDTNTADALARVGRLGVRRVVATGRSLFSVRRVLPPDAPIDYLVFSSGAGAVAWGTHASEPLLFSHQLPPAAVARAVAFALEQQMDVMVHAPAPDTHRFGYLAHGSGHPDLHQRIRMYEGHTFGLDAGRPGGGFEGAACQVLAISRTEDPLRTVERARSALPDLQVIRTTSPLDHVSLWLELFPARVCKSYAARWLAERLAIPPHRTFAIGNDFNDSDLLAWAHTAAVVDNAPHELKRQYRVVASHDQGGVAELIERYVLAPPA